MSRGTYQYWIKQLQLEEEPLTSTKLAKVSFVKVDSISIESIEPATLYVTWKDLKIEISSKEDTYLAAELIKKLLPIC